MSLSMFREAVAAVNERLKAGERTNEVPCPKCKQPRCIALEHTGPSKFAACDCCGFRWLVQ